jgi:hypothetical protein
MGMQDIPAGIPRENTYAVVGHGSLNTLTDADKLTFRVPDGIYVAFWVNHNELVEGKAIETLMNQTELIDPRWVVGAAQAKMHGGRNAYRRIGGRIDASLIETHHAGELTPIVGRDPRSVRGQDLPEVKKPGDSCPSYRVTYDPKLCDEYLTDRSKNPLNAGGVPSILTPPKISEADRASKPISERGFLLEVFLNLVKGRGATPALVHFACCRAEVDR